jgi:methyl coenzyme M reductase subunit C-like uncharacterized protein (methanogenesis marker protein 7)
MEEEVKIENNVTPNQTGIIRDEAGKFVGGVSGNPNGRPKDTEEQKVIKKATKQLIKEFKEALAEALPLISPVLVKKATEGDLGAIKEVNDRVMGKSRETIGLDGGEEGKAIVTILKYAKSDNQPVSDTITTPLSTERLPDTTVESV